MKNAQCWLLTWFIVTLVTTFGFAEKVKVGYDKSVDFSKYRTYTWAKPATPIMRPLLYQDVVATIDAEMKTKGLQRIEKDGDLTVIASGGIGIRYNMPASLTLDTTNWNGNTDPALLTAPQVAQGALVLDFVDRIENKLIWRGNATENLDAEIARSLPHIEKAIVKLLKGYPPKRSSK